MSKIEWAPISPDQVPIGHTSGAVVLNADPSAGLPSEWAYVMPVSHGWPTAPAVLKHCDRCGQFVYRSARAAEGMYLLCYDCGDRLTPGWRDTR